ncbi:MAG: hypothetical protein BGO52_02320 [Sphingobacteriales bacterium 44-61]|nr:MAG: hypothetical protein BGO52_02320 [Sphingobacteriales bacterium 44-61]
MIFFDFLFYNIYRFYSRHKEKGAESSSAGIIGGLQTVNLLILYELILLIQANNGKMRISFVIALLTFFQVYTYIRYIYKESNSVQILERKWLNKTESYRKQSIFLQYIYVSLTIIAFLGLAIYLGSQR